MSRSKILYQAGLTAVALAVLPIATAMAEDAPAKWTDTLKFTGQVEGGASVNFDSPSTKRNFGHLFDDSSNGVLLNQVLLTATRPIDSAATGYDFGFKLQGMWGSDARYTHFTHEFVNAGVGEMYFDIVEANVQAHTPWLTDGGIDWKVGQFSTPIGYEVIDASANPFYSHSYIFNFGIPLKSSGLFAAWHVTPIVDLYAGFDSGVNTNWDHGFQHSQNGGPLAFQGGIGLNLMDGNLTILGLTHAGTEIANDAISNGLFPPTVNPNNNYRELTDIVTTWKASDKLTLVNELNWIHDSALNGGKSADGYGIAVYGIGALTDTISLVGRAELFDDNDGVYVGQQGNNVDFIRGEEGLPALNPNTVTGGKTTYGEFTIGINYKPAFEFSYISSLVIRPELRYDWTLSETKPFNGGKDNGQETAAIDFILGF